MARPLRTSGKLLVGLFIFVGIPLLAWGVGDLAGFFAHPARATFVVVTALLQVVIVLAVPDAGRGTGDGVKPVARQRVALALLQLIPLAIVALAPWGDRRGVGVLAQHDVVRWAGVALYVLALGGMEWAEASLGRQFSVQVMVQEGHRLVTGGPYRYLRHPRYLGILGFAAGYALVFRSWLGLALAVPLLVVLLWRIHDEEALMGREFGDEWAAYRARSWRLVPFVF
jgi:protein-S-isoprenylcysteine O-methyltransferase Ste14